MDKELLNVLQGKRLRECLDRCHMSQKEFCRRAQNYNTSSFNQILNEKRTDRGIPPHYLAEWSDILGIDPGYFVAGEQYKTYDDFKGWNFAKSKWEEESSFLKKVNCRIINMNMVDNERIESYYIFNNDTKKSACISAKKMDEIKSRIIEYIKFIVQEAMKEGDASD